MFYLKLCTDFYDCDNDEPAPVRRETQPRPAVERKREWDRDDKIAMRRRV